MPSVETVYGQMELIGEPEDLICRCLAVTGEWSYTEAALCASALTAEDFVWDAGAYLGTFGLGVRQRSGSQLLAIEPDPQAAAALRRNLEANAAGGYAVAEVALGSTEGRVLPMLADAGHNRGTQRFGPAAPGVCGDAGLRCTTLARLRAEFGDYTALKLDIEGAELVALTADARFIRETKTLVWAECNETRWVEKLLGFFLWAGLEPVYVAFPAFRRENHRGCREPLYPIAYEAAICGGGVGQFRDLPPVFEGEEIIVRPLASFQELKRAMWDTPRWGRNEWTEMSRPQLIARLGRMQRGESYREFLAESG